jgi:hypothetical protein
VNFKRYHLPDGHRSLEHYDVGEELEVKAQELTSAGWSFEMELLSTGVIHLDCCDGEEQLWNVLCPPEKVMVGVKAIVEKAHAEWLRRDRPKAEN